MGEGGGSPEVLIPENVLSNTPKRWGIPQQAIINTIARARRVDINPALRTAFSREGQPLGLTLETTVEANPDDQQASLEFVFRKDPQGNYYVLTNGSQSWSSSVAVGKHAELPMIKTTDQLVGMRSLDKSLGGKTVPFYDPGLKEQEIPKTEGRSYGWVGFRDSDPKSAESKENMVLGVIPSLDSLEGIRYRQEGDNIIVTVSKNLEGVSTQRPVTFKVFLGSAQKYADLMIAFSNELSKQVNIPLMKDRVIGFSWPAYGQTVTQVDVQKEIEAGKGIIDTYTIDDGYETDSGSFQIDTKKFPDMPGLVKTMQEAGIKPGIWVAPFKIKGKSADQLLKAHSDWFMKDEKGKPVQLPITGEGSIMLDISVPEVREYLANNFLDLAKMGFETFKVDFLQVPFAAGLQNKDKTSVEYYRQTFTEIRQHIHEVLGKEIELIGCGAPMMESIGLFNGIRMTGDSALPNLEGWPGVGKAVPLLKRIPFLSRLYSDTNTGMYHDATAVGARRILPLNKVYGLFWDGVHIADEKVPLTPDKKERLNISIQALNRLGVSNMFLGDSLVRVGEQGRQAWRKFIDVFKRGNVDLEFAGRKLPKIPEKYTLPKAV